MVTPAEALVALSPLPVGTPAEHLLAITAGGGSGTEPLLGVVQTPPPLGGALVQPATLTGALSAPQPLAGMLTQASALTGSLAAPAPLVGVLDCNVAEPSGELPGTLLLKYDAGDIPPQTDGTPLAAWAETVNVNDDWDLTDTGRGDPGDESLYEATTGPNGGPAVFIPEFGWMDSIDVGVDSIPIPFIVACVFQPTAGSATRNVVAGTDTAADILFQFSGGSANLNHGTSLTCETNIQNGEWIWFAGRVQTGNQSRLVTSRGTGALGGASSGQPDIEQTRLGANSAGTGRFTGRVKMYYLWDAASTTLDDVVQYLQIRFPGIVEAP